MSKSSKQKASSNTIALNRKVKHDFFIEETFECGLVLQGWEVKSLRAGKANLTDSYVKILGAEAWLIGGHLSPLKTTSTHYRADPTRSRKLLLHNAEIAKLIGKIERQGYTLVATALYWKNNRVKCEIALAKGKKQFDKRASEKEKDWQRQKARVLKTNQ